MLNSEELRKRYNQPAKRGVSPKPFRMVWGRGVCTRDKNRAYVRSEAFGLLCWTCYLLEFGEQLELYDGE